MDPKDAWLATLGQLQIQLHRATYETWVAGSQFVAFADGVFTISVKNNYAKDWLEQRLYRLVQGSLSTIFRQQVQVKFTVQPQVKKPARIFDEDDELFLPPPPRQETGRAFLSSKPIEKTPSIAFAQGERLNPDYVFENFVVGNNNQIAHAAACSVARSSDHHYNPLFIYSGVGLGKTHLLQAIGHACTYRRLNVLYISAETFTNDLIRAIRTHQTEAFRDHYRRVDVLLMDDVQFLAGKESSQEELFHTFNALHNQGSLIVLTADRKPRNIQALDDRLRSRFEWGLAIELQEPDVDTRLTILQCKARAQDMELPLPAAEVIASSIKDNIRDLEGALNRVLAQYAQTRQPLTRPYIEAILRDEMKFNKRKLALNLQDILEATATFHQLTLDDLLSKERSKNVATARHVAIYLAREEINATLPEIGRVLGGRTHSTILNSYQKVVERLEIDPQFRREITELRKYLRERAS